jgi:multidrug efflux pump subunit AcrA (membrane-fusion protein)
MKRNTSSRFSRVKNSVSNRLNPSRVRPFYTKTTEVIRRRPIFALLCAFGILLLVMIVTSIFNKTPEQPEENAQVKSVSVYSIGESPTVTLQAQIEKNGVVNITALTGGVVNSIPVIEGQTVTKGQNLVQLATNYNGASLPGVQTQLARTQYNNVKDTYETQRDIIKKQRVIAEKSNENSEELRQINEASLQDTRTLLGQNENLLNMVNLSIGQLESNNGTPAEIGAAKQNQAQLQSGVNQLRSSVRTLEYQTNADNLPTELTTIQKDLTLRQLDVQEKAIDLNKDVSKLQFQIAAVSESLMYPSSPFAGIVERIHVQVGESVTPGTVLATISKTDIKATAVVNTPRKFAMSISQIEPTILMVKSKKYELYPEHISSVATSGELYSVIYSLPSEALTALSEEGYVPLQVPIGFADTSSAVPFVPIDSVYQGQDSSYVNILNGNKVEAKKVDLGSVYGKYVEVTSGLNSGDKVILDRTVISGDTVQISQPTE